MSIRREGSSTLFSIAWIRSAISVGRRGRYGQISIAVLALVLSGAGSPGFADPTSDLSQGTFEHHDVPLDTAGSLTVMAGFLLGGDMADLAVVDVDEHGARRLRVFAFNEGSWASVLDSKLRSGVSFVDLATIDGRDRLITFADGRVSWFDPEQLSERSLGDVGASFNANPRGPQYAGAEPLVPSHGSEIPQVDITRDLNHDGRDDLVVPDTEGFWIATQLTGGAFTDFVRIGPPEPFLDAVAKGEERSYGDVGMTALTIPWYLSRVHQMDFNQDGLLDLVFWNKDHFDVHLQDAGGGFETEAETFASEVPFDSDGIYSLIFAFSDRNTLALLLGLGKRTEQRILHSLRDMNGDGVPDMVILALKGRSLLRMRSTYEVHFGTARPGGLRFDRNVDASTQPAGRAGGMQVSGYSSQWFEDFDGDGQVDILLRDVAVGLGGMTRALVGNSVPVDVELYRAQSGTYPREPTVQRKIRRFDPLSGMGNVFFPTVLVGDVDGDGRLDLLAGKGPDELHLYWGVPGPSLLAERPEQVMVSLPYDERDSWLVDLDGKGGQDILIYHSPTRREPYTPHRLILLIAR